MMKLWDEKTPMFYKWREVKKMTRNHGRDGMVLIERIIKTPIWS